MKILPLALHPKPELIRFDTSLRYTDILFGFVIREIFWRLQYWQSLNRHILLQLSVCVALVLGSWIGYRRSLNRSSYEVKFFNLPLFRFLLDQAMLIFYFQLAGSTPADLAVISRNPPDPSQLAQDTIKLLVFIFVLYLAWDLLGIWMANSEDAGKPRYAEARNNVDKDDNVIKDPNKRQMPDWYGFAISAGGFVSFGLLWLLIKSDCSGIGKQVFPLTIAIVLLVLYRFLKEIKTAWLQQQPSA
jgi:hypothetical protein